MSLLVRLVHDVGAVAWVGSILTVWMLVSPALDRSGWAARATVMRWLGPRLAAWQLVSAGLVIASGATTATLNHRLDGGVTATMRSTWGQAIAVGSVASLLMVVLGVVAIRPLIRRLTAAEAEVAADPTRAALSSGELGDEDPEWWHARQQLVMASVFEVTLALLAMVSMVIARIN